MKTKEQSKHTPGPWTIVSLSGTGGPFAIRMDDHGKSHYGAQWIGSEANARLIAAAPTLLGICREIYDSENAQDALAPAWMGRLRSAIATAEGHRQN